MQNTDKRTAALSLRANTLWNAFGCFFYLGCQWLTTVLVVRLSPDYNNSGMLAFAMAYGTIFASIGLYKIRAFQISDLNNEYSNGEYIGFRFVSIIMGLVLSVLYLPFTASSIGFLYVSITYLVFKSDEVFSDVFYGIYQRQERMDYIGKSQFLRGILSINCFAIPLAITHNLIVALVVMSLSCICVTFFFDIPHAKLFGSVRPSLEFDKMKSLAATCFLAMLATLCANSIVSLVRQYYGLVYGSESLGIYASVATPAVLIQVAATYLYSPLIGDLAKTRFNKGQEAFSRQFIKVFILLTFVIVAFIIPLSLAGNPILQLVFGKSIAPYTYLFPYVLVATGCMGLLFYISDVLVVVRKIREMLFCDVLALLAALLLAVILTRTIGMNGINFAIIGGSALAVIPSAFIILGSQKEEPSISSPKGNHAK